jgi:hypothetical protein
LQGHTHLLLVAIHRAPWAMLVFLGWSPQGRTDLGVKPVLDVLNGIELGCMLQPPLLCVFLFVLREREEIDPVPEGRNQRGGRETKRTGQFCQFIWLEIEKEKVI